MKLDCFIYLIDVENGNKTLTDEYTYCNKKKMHFYYNNNNNNNKEKIIR